LVVGLYVSGIRALVLLCELEQVELAWHLLCGAALEVKEAVVDTKDGIQVLCMCLWLRSAGGQWEARILPLEHRWSLRNETVGWLHVWRLCHLLRARRVLPHHL
jgi:hypothetical protein